MFFLFIFVNVLLPEKYLKSIIEKSKVILNHEESNHQAASMIAIVMAELGHFREAKEIFNQIESNQQNFGVLANVAHLEYLKVLKKRKKYFILIFIREITRMRSKYTLLIFKNCKFLMSLSKCA